MARLHDKFVRASTPVSQTEQDIDHYITVHPDGVYDEALSADSRWEVFYHLSDMRQALFGWYDMPKDADVLEIGCGFGALTGVLADHAAHVAALDDSLFRARACAKRGARKKISTCTPGSFATFRSPNGSTSLPWWTCCRASPTVKNPSPRTPPT